MHPKTIIPSVIESEVREALSYYPELSDTPIVFKFKKNIKKSVMLAQPTFSSLFKSRSNRGYIIQISETFKITDKEYRTIDVPKDVLIGWIGHELGHVIDYQQKNKLEMIRFGVKYVLLKEHVKKAERAADSAAVLNGMAEYIIKTKEFILNNADIEASYKNRIKEYYLSPEEIREMVDQQKKAEKIN